MLDSILKDWKDQAVLYLLAGDVVFYLEDERKNGKKRYLVDILDEKAGIRTITSLIDLWSKINEQETKMQPLSRSPINKPDTLETKKQDEQKEFFRGLGLLQNDEKTIIC